MNKPDRLTKNNLTNQELEENLKDLIEQLEGTGRDNIKRLTAAIKASNAKTQRCHHHHHYTGGLIQHLLGVKEVAWELIHALEMDEPLIVLPALTHDLCDTNMPSNASGHGGRSLSIVNHYKVRLLDCDGPMIKFHMDRHGDIDELTQAWAFPGWQAIHLADHINADGHISCSEIGNVNLAVGLDMRVGGKEVLNSLRGDLKKLCYLELDKDKRINWKKNARILPLCLIPDSPIVESLLVGWKIRPIASRYNGMPITFDRIRLKENRLYLMPQQLPGEVDPLVEEVTKALEGQEVKRMAEPMWYIANIDTKKTTKEQIALLEAGYTLPHPLFVTAKYMSLYTYWHSTTIGRWKLEKQEPYIDIDSL